MNIDFPHARVAKTLSSQPVCCVAVDTEEDFDWDNPLKGTRHSTGHLRNLPLLTEILQAYGAKPTYLVTFPVLEDPVASGIIRYQVERGLCSVGLQLHSWVTPPFGGENSIEASFLANLDPNQEEQKLITLKARFIECFGFPPVVFRAGRYGLSRHTPRLLEKHGFTVDTSIAPRTSFAAEGGPDYGDQDTHPFWFGDASRLLEVPLCRTVVGWGGTYGIPVYQRVAGSGERSGLVSLLARGRFAERITLSPEGNDLPAMRRLLRGMLKRGETVFSLSFHSSSLGSGTNPYVRSQADLHCFYDRLSAILDHMAGKLAYRFAGLDDLPGLMAPDA